MIKKLQGVLWRFCRRTRIFILRVPCSDAAWAAPEGFALVRVTGTTPNESDHKLVEEAMTAAGEPSGLAAPRFAHGDEFLGWVAGGKVVSFGWITYRDREAGFVRLKEASGRVFLFNFHTLEAYRRQGLYTALLSAIRSILGREQVEELIIDVNSKNTASRTGIEKAGFLPIARVSYVTILNRWHCLFTRTVLDPSNRPVFPEEESSNAQAPSDGQITTRVLQDETEWDAIRHQWDELYAASPTASTPLDFVWLRNWWRVYKPALKAAELRIITVWRGTRLIGAIPLYISSIGGPLGVRRLGFLSTGEDESEETCPDYMNLLCLPGEEAASAGAIWNEVAGMRWDFLELLDFPADAALARSQPVKSFARGTCPIAEIAGGFDAYLGRLSGHYRSNARRALRDGELPGVRFEVVGPSGMNRTFDKMIELHQDRWAADGKPGVFAAQRFVEFHRNVVADWLPLGRAVLAQLLLDNETIAVIYGFITKRKFDFYQSGVKRDPALPMRSPGILANLLLVKKLAAQGVTEYDFLRGGSTYKKSLATCERQLSGLRIRRPTLRTAIYLSVQPPRRIFRSLVARRKSC